MKVFLVEDSHDIRERLGSMISDIEHAVLVGQSGTEEEAVAGILAAVPDLVILDLHLASGSGIEVLRRIKAQRPAIQVVVLTNHGYPQYRKRCMDLGAEHFLDKSRDIAALEGILASLSREHAKSPEGGNK